MSHPKVATQASSAARTQSRPAAPQSGRAGGPPETEHPVLQLQRTVGNRRVAAGLPRTPAATVPTELPRAVAEPVPLILQRKCACGTADKGTCPECKDDKPLQRKAEGAQSTTIPPSVSQVLQRPGQPMDRDTRDFMESRFGRDFGGVRLHTDGEAARSARELDAHAYTVGNQIVFGDGRYRPGTEEGRHLLAHELAHTVQQQGLRARSEAPLDVTSSGQALERQADQAADAALRGEPMPALAGVSAPVVARAPRKNRADKKERELNTGEPRIIGKARTSSAKPGTPGGGTVMEFKVANFPLPKPKAKGKALERFEKARTEGSLRATIAFSKDRASNVVVPQERASTEVLKANWLRKVDWTKNVAQHNWWLAGGDSSKDKNQQFQPVVNGTTCDMDHIQELQVGGTNVDENIQVLDPSPNRSSGSRIKSRLLEIAQMAYDGVSSDRKPDQVILQLTSLAADDGREFECSGATPEPGKATSCCQIESHVADPAVQERIRRCAPKTPSSSATSAASASSAPAGTAPYEIRAGAFVATIHAHPVGSDTHLLESGPVNATAAELIPGVRLEILRRTADKGDFLLGRIDDVPISDREQARRIPVNLVGHPPELEFKVASDGKLKLLKPSSQLAFTYPYLSRGTVDLVYDPETGFSGPGKLTPSMPLLSRTSLAVALDPDSLRVSLETPAEDLSTPIPHLRFTRAELTALLLPEFEPKGVLAFEVGPKDRPVATGELNVTADKGGLVLTGTLDAHLPRVDQARGDLTYRNGQWSGGITIASKQIGIPGIQSGQLNLGLTNEGVSVGGEVIAAIPGGNVVTFRVQRTKTGDYVYEGDATLQVPGLKPVDAQIEYDGRTFRGTATTGVDLGRLSGKVELHYEADDDKDSSDLWGKGTLTIKRGRVNGTFNGKVADGVLTGEGHVWVQLTKSLGGHVGITLDKQQRLRVSGGVTVPAPIQIFPRVPEGGGHKELLNRSLDIPIVGITLGPLGAIGLIARISAGFGVRYHFGPGTLDKIQLGVAFNPLEEDAALTADGHAELDIPAYAGAYLRLRGALGLSAVAASVTGGVEAVAELGLAGGARSAVALHYEKGGLALEGVTRISANPVFRLGLIANIIAEAGALGVSYEWRQDWKLASIEVGTGGELGMEAKIGYSSKEGVRLPALSEIRWIYPQIDPGAILQTLLKRVMR